jgi:DNA-binding NarL/FixJ family response regulator
MALRLLVIDDHPLFLEGLSSVLRRMDAGMLVYKSMSAEQGFEIVDRTPLDMVLIDLHLPGMDGLTAIRHLHRRHKSPPVVVLSAMERESDIQRAIEAGAMGYITKSSSSHQLFEALRQIQEGITYLPPNSTSAYRGVERRAIPDAIEMEAVEDLSLRQMEVLTRLCQGLPNKVIAKELDLSEKTVKWHVTTIFRALGVVNRTQAVLAAKRLGLG